MSLRGRRISTTTHPGLADRRRRESGVRGVARPSPGGAGIIGGALVVGGHAAAPGEVEEGVGGLLALVLVQPPLGGTVLIRLDTT